MDLLDINLTLDSSLFAPSYSVFCLFYWQIVKKTTLLSGFKNPYKNINETRKLESIREQHFVKWKNAGTENQTKTQVWEDSSLCPETLTDNAVQEFILRLARENY